MLRERGDKPSCALPGGIAAATRTAELLLSIASPCVHAYHSCAHAHTRTQRNAHAPGVGDRRKDLCKARAGEPCTQQRAGTLRPNVGPGACGAPNSGAQTPSTVRATPALVLKTAPLAEMTVPMGIVFARQPEPSVLPVLIMCVSQPISLPLMKPVLLVHMSRHKPTAPISASRQVQ